MAQLNALDYAILCIIGLSALYGLTRGVLRMATSILSLALGLYLASSYCGRVGAYAQQQLNVGPTAAVVIGYVAVFLIVLIAIEYAGRRLIQLARIIHLSLIDRLGGGAFGGAIGAIFAGLMVLALTALLQPKPLLLRDSELAPEILAYNQLLVAYVPPQVKKTYEEKRDELLRYWSKNRKASVPRAKAD